MFSASLSDAKALYISQVKARAAAARDAVSTPGKEAIYAEKQRQAAAGHGRYIDAEARRAGLTNAEAADRILKIADAVAERLAAIDDDEQDRISKIKAAQTIADAYSHSITR